MSDLRRRRPEKHIRRTSSNSSNRQGYGQNNFSKVLFTFSIFIGALLFYYYYLTTYTAQHDILKQSNLPNALIDDIYNETTWGTMRPHLYFGMNSKYPLSPFFGLLWYQQPQEQFIRELPIRHWSEHGDDVKFSWLAHDFHSFGRQQITDKKFQLKTDWLRVGQSSWSARFTGDTGNSSHALIFYMALREPSAWLQIPIDGLDATELLNGIKYMEGYSPHIDQFSMSIKSGINLAQNKVKFSAISHLAYSITPQLEMEIYRNIGDIYKYLLSASLARPDNDQVELILQQNKHLSGEDANSPANFAAIQITVRGKFDLQMDFVADSDKRLKNFVQEFEYKLTEFDARFAEIFPIDYQSISDLSKEEIVKWNQMAKSALANILGGIGVWHGYALVRTEEHKDARPYGPLSLLSAVPSRPFFPRGFLWDEGFHNLLIRQFDPNICLQIFATWLDTMNADGWIPREIILGLDAQAKVPAEFLVQSPHVANPPVFFYVMEKFVRNSELLKLHYNKIGRLYPRLKQFYIWLRTTQQGPRTGTMQWQGRNRTTDRELNPKILPSGLDDFPRATHPSSEEFHLDLFCWMAISSRVLRQMAEIFGDSAFVPIVEEDLRLFNSMDTLDSLHWSEKRQIYADYGLHSERVQLIQQAIVSKDDKRGAKGQGKQVEKVFVRKVMDTPRLRLVDDVFGYVNLFPLLLRLIPANHPKLGILLRSLNHTEDLWSPYGLRSLSTKSLYYLARNTEHDPPYWRGAIWININYLALDALRYYAQSGGTNARLAAELYDKLRLNVVRNIADQFERSGFFWEQYNDRTGEGMGTRPFTGWTALVLNILAENYD